jgi:hypothetical protein
MKYQTIPKLKKKVWTLFSLYIRHKYSKNGMCQCFTCYVVKPIKEMQAGHFVSRMYGATFIDERNVHPQCSKCNILLKSNPDAYALNLQRKYGNDIIEILHKKSRKPFKFDRNELLKSIEELKERLKPYNI